MIGNDIVDLAQAKRDSNWQRRGFLDKLFTAHEQQLIRVASNAERMVWTLWSMKESAYKASVRETGRRVFAPRKLVCELDSWTGDGATGRVFYEQNYRTKTILTPHYISSVAAQEAHFFPIQQAPIQFANTTHEHQSLTIRAALIQYFARALAIPAMTIQVGADKNRAPILILSGLSPKIVTLPLSISHHGNYGAFAVSC